MKYIIDNTTLKAIADTIREAESSTATILVSDYNARLRALLGLSGSVTPTPTPPIIDVPQTGTWQLKTTTNKSYVIFGTDDDNVGNAKFARLLRTYDIPYSMNVESFNLEKNIGSDVDDTMFTSSDAPSVFSSNTTPLELGKYLHDNGLGEVSQHGGIVLWDSAKLVDNVLDDVYATYTSSGGSKTKEELKTAIMEELATTDISQGASVVKTNRAKMNEAYGFDINTVGCWGGTPTPIIDSISIPLTDCKSNAYDWRADNYIVAQPYIGQWKPNNKSTYDICRCSTDLFPFSEMIDRILSIPKGHVVEMYWHEPLRSVPNIDDWRTMFTQLNELKASGRVEAITKEQYYKLGEFVDNPITDITLTRNGNLKVGDTDSDSAYTVTVTYADGTSGNPQSDMILDRSKVNTSTSGSYEVTATYRGFNASINVVVMSNDFTYPDGLKNYDNWFVYQNNTNGNWYAGNYSKEIIEAKENASTHILCFSVTEKSGKLNGWKSTNNGATWEQVTTNRTCYNTILVTNKTSDTDGGYWFDGAYKDDITLIESSNFEWNY